MSMQPYLRTRIVFAAADAGEARSSDDPNASAYDDLAKAVTSPRWRRKRRSQGPKVEAARREIKDRRRHRMV
jgi:hypothetical protein